MARCDTTVPCPLCPYGGAKVGSRGNPTAPIVVIAEGPGSREIASGIPLYGPSGKVFWRTLPGRWWDSRVMEDPDNAIELAERWKDDILVLNAMQCLPPRKKNDATKNEALLARGAQTCHDRMIQQIKQHPRKLIITMGNHATRSVTGSQGLKITQIRGKLIPSPLSELGVLPVVHPAALLRGTGNYRQFKMDIHYGIDIARGAPLKTPVIPKYVVCDTLAKIRHAVKALITKPYIAADIETGGHSGFNRWKDRILCIGLAASADLVYIVPGNLIKELSILFRFAKGRFIWHNGKFDLGFVRQIPGLTKARLDEDTMLLSYALDESGGIHDLEQVAGDLINAPDYKHVLKPFLGKGKTYADVPTSVLYQYLALDVSNTLQIFHILRPQVSEDAALEKLYTKVLLPASEFLYQIEMHGIAINLVAVARQEKRLQREIDSATRRLDTICEKYNLPQINPNSPAQLAVVLYDKLKLRTKRFGDRSTGADTLEGITPRHPILAAIQDYRKASKAKSTYVDSIGENLQDDGRIHCTFLIHGTRTGRLSSRKPNMQNQPRDKRIRSMFQARPGYVLVKADLNQAELRSLADRSNDRFLVPLYNTSGRSLHKETAREFGLALDTEGLIRAKAVNFGVVYGRTAPDLAEEYGIPTALAQKWIDAWFARSPEAKSFIDSCRKAPLHNKTLVTPFGRKKRHWIVTQENLAALQNEASNFPHQSIASDANLLGAARAAPILRRKGVFPVNIVHDEIMFECPDIPEMITWTKKVIIECMEAIPREWGITRVPFKAEANVGKRWSIWRAEKDGAEFKRSLLDKLLTTGQSVDSGTTTMKVAA